MLRMSTIWIDTYQKQLWKLAGIFDPRSGTKQNLLREIAGIVATDLPIKMRSIQTAIVNRDGKSLVRTAHSLRGGLSILVGSQDLDALQQLELMGRENDLAGAEALYEELRVDTNSFLQYIGTTIVDQGLAE
jgi:hypothetical protein